jgi:LmbE family N-acetylglucosaminyl deacetylase
MNVVLIGAHPDDSEVVAGGTAALWSEAGFAVTIVSMTNGNKGHQTEKGAALAARRKRESKRSADLIGAKSIVLNTPDGELEPTLAVRKKVVSLIRKANADLVITHRPNDYHPDHRYTSQVVQDAAYMVTVPHFLPSVPALRKNPTFMYFMDRFQKPVPFSPDVAVGVDSVIATKWRMLDAMDSQFYEWLPWHAGILDTLPKKKSDRIAWIESVWGTRFAAFTNVLSPAFQKWYSKKVATGFQYGEFFELSEYGHQPNKNELLELFPFLS